MEDLLKEMLISQRETQGATTQSLDLSLVRPRRRDEGGSVQVSMGFSRNVSKSKPGRISLDKHLLPGASDLNGFQQGKLAPVLGAVYGPWFRWD